MSTAPEWDPTKGPRLNPAWQAAVRILADREWHDWQFVIDAMLDSSDLLRATCQNVLYSAIKQGDYTRKGTYRRRAQIDTREIRFTEYGLQRWVE